MAHLQVGDVDQGAGRRSQGLLTQDAHDELAVLHNHLKEGRQHFSLQWLKTLYKLVFSLDLTWLSIFSDRWARELLYDSNLQQSFFFFFKDLFSGFLLLFR